LLLALEYIAAMTHIETHQARHTTPTHSPLQAIQRGRIKIACHSGLVVIFWSCFRRCHSRPKPVVGLLALPIPPVGWLHSDGKFIIYGLCFHINQIRLNILTLTRVLSLLFLGTQFGGDCGYAVLQLFGDHPQQMATTVW
jgi:hypothetical protein